MSLPLVWLLGMLRHAKISEAMSILIETEVGLMYRLRKEDPDKEFIHPQNEQYVKYETYDRSKSR